MSRRTLSLLTTLLAMAASACGTQGQEGLLEFRDPATYPGGSHHQLHTHIAVGAQLQIHPSESIQGSLASPDVAQRYTADVDPLGIFEVVSEGKSLEVRALQTGTATLTVTADNGLVDHIELTAAPLDHVEFMAHAMPSSLFGWDTPAEHPELGYVLQPGAAIGIGAKLRDIDGGLLVGHGLLHWSLEHGEGTLEPFEEAVNSILVRAGEGPGILEIAAGATDRVRVEVVPPGPPADLAVAQFVKLKTERVISPLQATEGAVGQFVFPLDRSGRLVVPRSPQPIEVTLLEGPPCLVKEVEDHSEINLVLFQACPGDGRIRFSHMGATVDYDLHIDPRDEDSPDPEQCDEELGICVVTGPTSP